MESYVITISDDLDLFESKEAAERYLEPWIIEPKNNFRAYSAKGNILSPSIITKNIFWLFKAKAISLKQTETIEEEKLRNEVANYLSKLNPSEKASFLSMNLIDLVSKLRELKGFSS